MQKTIHYPFKVPSLSANSTPTTVIGIIDSSGSMSSVWPHIVESWNNILSYNPNAVTITFSNSAKLNSGKLTNNIYDYQGGGTHIESGFALLNEVLKTDANILPNLTLVFISDGEDNCSSTLAKRLQDLSFHIDKTKNCKFISLAVGSGFPTFVAMNLRSMYHNGDPNLPPVFLIEQTTKEKIMEQFSLLSPYLIHRSIYEVSPSVKYFPWSENYGKVHEGQWILVSSNEIKIDDKVFKAENKINQMKEKEEEEKKELESPPKWKEVSILEMIEIVREWLQELQLLSIKGKVTEESNQAIEFINEWRERQNQSKSGATKGESKRKTFFERINERFGKETEQDLLILIKEIKAFSEENLLSKLSQSEAAKRLAIGTKTGKYHSKAMNLRGISVDDYAKIRDEFVSLFSNFKLNYASGQEASVISLQNQKEILLENDLINGLNICPSQYDLVETLPLVGHGIRVHRCDGALINPWLIQVVYIARHNKVVDTVSIQQNGNQLKLKVGGDEEELINAVLPLYDEKDYDLKPFLNSRLFHLLMTFNLLQNVDTLYENAYSAALGAALIYLLDQKESEWKRNLIALIRKTLKITYFNSVGFKKYCSILASTPNLALVTEHPENPVKCEDISKAILALDALIYLEEEELSENKKEEIFERIFIEYFGRLVFEPNDFIEYFELKDASVLDKVNFSPSVDKILEIFTIDKLKKFYTSFELKSKIIEEIKNLNLKIGVEFDLQLCEAKILKHIGKINLPLLEKIYEFYLEKKVNRSKYVLYFNHANNYRNSFERNTSELNSDAVSIIDKLKKKFENNFLEQKSLINDVWPIISGKYSEYLSGVHVDLAIPVSNDFIKQYCDDNKALNIKFEDYKMNQVSNLLINACLNRNCPFFMVPNNSLAQHLISSKTVAPAFNKTIKIFCNSEKSEKEILEIVLRGDCLDKSLPVPEIPESFKKNLENPKNIEEHLENIKKIREMYRKLL